MAFADVAAYVRCVPLSGEQVPDEPPFPVGQFRPLSDWWLHFKVSVVRSAYNGGALLAERKGERGGWWYAAKPNWKEWAATYRERSRKRAEGIAAKASLRALGGIRFCQDCRCWKWNSVSGLFHCNREGAGARRCGGGFRRNEACSHYEEREDV